MSTTFRAALAAVVLVSSAAFARADDKEDVKKSGVAFAKAIHEGNTKEARKYAVDDAKSNKFIDALGPVTVAREKMIDAAIAKFGDDGKTIFGSGRGAQPAATPQYSTKDFDDAQIDVQGDTASVHSKNSSNSNQALKFRKQGGLWKVDLTSTLSDEQVDRVAEMMPKVATAMDQTTGDIKDGKYQNVTQARQGFGRHMAAAMGFQRGPADGPPSRQR